MPRRLRRNKLELFNDILTAINKASSDGEIIPTRIQQQTNLSYDKFSKNLKELEKRKLVSNISSIQITKEGKQFLQDYEKINEFLTKMKIDYFDQGDNKNEL